VSIDDLSTWMHGIKYITQDKHNSLTNSQLNLSPASCAVCYVPRRSALVMIPAKTSCPAGWTQEYGGYIMAERLYYTQSTSNSDDRNPTNYVCVDAAPEAVPEADRVPSEGYGGSFLFAKLQCGSLLPCEKFKQGWEVACVVCSK